MRNIPLVLALLVSLATSVSAQVSNPVGPGPSPGGSGSGNATISPATGNTAGDFPAFSNTTTTLTDSTYSPTSFAPAGTVVHVTTNTLVTAAQFSAYDTFEIDGSGLTLTMPPISTPLATSTGGIVINTALNAVTLAPNAADKINGGTAGASLAINSLQPSFVNASATLGFAVTNIVASATGGTNTQVLYNNAGSQGGISGVISNGTSMQFNDTDFLLENAAANGGAILHASATTGTSNFTLPTVTTDTLVSLTATQTESNKTFVAPVLGAALATTINGVTIPVTTDTVGLLGTVQTISAAKTFSAAGAASVPAVALTGAPFSGTGTTSTPLLYLNGGSAPSTWSTNGTMFGINLPSGFSGNAFDLHANGGASLLSMGINGSITSSNTITGATGVFSTVHGVATASAVLTLESTSAAGTTDSIVFKTGSQVTALTIDTNQLLNLGVASSTGNGTAAVTTTSLGPVGTTCVVGDWFKLKDNSGNTRYLPMYSCS